MVVVSSLLPYNYKPNQQESSRHNLKFIEKIFAKRHKNVQGQKERHIAHKMYRLVFCRA